MTASSGDAGRRLPFRHGVEAVKMGGRGRAAGAGWNEKIADGREHVDEPLQVLGDRKPCIARSRRRNGRCEFSARLFSPLCERCSTSGMI